MFRDRRLTAVHNNHRAANTSAIAGDIYCSMVMIDIDTDKLANSSGSSQATKIMDKAGGKAGETHDCPVDLHHKGTGSIHFRPGGLTNV